VLSASGCGGGKSRDESELLPPDLGESLVQRADSVRASIERDDACTARGQAAALERAIADAIEQNRVPPALEGELLRRSSSLHASIVCVEPPPPPRPPPPPIPKDEEGEEGDD
jgi:hypothetical protein